MILELFLAFVCGLVAGIFTGLAPGIHINLVAALLVSLLPRFSSISPLAAVIFIVVMTVTHVFLDFIPSVFLGVPEEDTFLAILPSHELTLQGRGYEAVMLLMYGSLCGVLILLLATPLYLLFLPTLYTFLKTTMPYLLLAISCYIILREVQVTKAFVVFMLAGFLGLITFSLPVREPLTPLLTGLFGIAALLGSLKETIPKKEQVILPLKEKIISRYEYIKAMTAALIAAPLCSFLPGIGSGHAATIGAEIVPQERKGFLVLIGAISMSVATLSFVTLYVLDRTRSGSAAAIQKILPVLTMHHLLIILIVCILAALISFFLALSFAKLTIRVMKKIPYTTITKGVLLMLMSISFLVSGWLGLLVTITGTTLGLYCMIAGVKRIQLMGALIVPTILYYVTNP